MFKPQESAGIADLAQKFVEKANQRCVLTSLLLKSPHIDVHSCRMSD